MKATALLITVLTFAACESNQNYVPTEREDRVLDAYTALAMLNGGFPSTSNPDSVRLYSSRVDSILRHFELSREEFRNGMEDLVSSSDRFRDLFGEINTRLQQQSPR